MWSCGSAGAVAAALVETEGSEPKQSHGHSHGHEHECKDHHCTDHDHGHDDDHGDGCSDADCTDHTHSHAHHKASNDETTAAKRFGIHNFIYSRRRPFHPQRLKVWAGTGFRSPGMLEY